MASYFLARPIYVKYEAKYLNINMKVLVFEYVYEKNLDLSNVQYEDYGHFRCLCVCITLCSVHIQDNMKCLLSYIVSYYLRHFDEVSNGIYPCWRHFSLTFPYLVILLLPIFFMTCLVSQDYRCSCPFSLCLCVFFIRMLEKRRACILSLNLTTYFRHHR